jgi:hypothetical protein
MPFLFCHISWMREYKGHHNTEDQPQRGGRWVEENGTAHECCNFLPDDNGVVYGHVETSRGDNDTQVGIEQLGGVNVKDNFIDGIDVIWTATHEKGGKRVVGWYKNAKVFRERQYHEDFPTEQHEEDGVNSYRITTTQENAHCIAEDERDLIVPSGRGWPGHCPLFYPGNYPDNEELMFLLQKLSELMGNNKSDGEVLEDLQEIENDESLNETEKQRLTTARIGQGDFRKRVIELCERSCAVTKCSEISILRASHIKPWRKATNEERLDEYNGLLLIPNLDILLDKGFISFGDDGKIIISERLSSEDREKLGVYPGMRMSVVDNSHKPYLKWHREKIFLSS